MVPIVFERKSIGDLYGTLGKGYKRFKREIIRAQESNTQLFIIIEGTLTEVSLGYEYSTKKGSSMILQLFSLWTRHGIQPIFCSSRKEMAHYITQFYLSAGREYIRRK